MKVDEWHDAALLAHLDGKESIKVKPESILKLIALARVVTDASSLMEMDTKDCDRIEAALREING